MVCRGKPACSQHVWFLERQLQCAALKIDAFDGGSYQASLSQSLELGSQAVAQLPATVPVLQCTASAS